VKRIRSSQDRIQDGKFLWEEIEQSNDDGEITRDNAFDMMLYKMTENGWTYNDAYYAMLSHFPGGPGARFKGREAIKTILKRTERKKREAKQKTKALYNSLVVEVEISNENRWCITRAAKNKEMTVAALATQLLNEMISVEARRIKEETDRRISEIQEQLGNDIDL
jgi:hypothetical protein